MKKTLIGITVIFATISVLWLFLAYAYPTTLPTKSTVYFIDHLIHPHAKMTRQVVGFLPYWEQGNIQYIQLDKLSEVNYFALSPDKNGNILAGRNDEEDPGWLAWNDQRFRDFIAKAQIMGTRLTLTIALQKNSVIESILDNKKRQQTLTDNIMKLITTNRLNGITLDFEYQGKPDKKYKQKFTGFVQDLSDTVRSQSPNVTLTLTLMPLSAREPDLFDFEKLNPLVNTYIGMSYDYYGVSSDIAGPVAPMHGFAENKYFFDVSTTYADYEKYIPKNKIIMGIPYYGWDWAVRDGKTILSKTFPVDDPNNYTAVLSYTRMRRLMEDKDLKQKQCQRDAYALETWCWYADPKTKVDHQIWLEDTKSITIKYDFARQSSFSGVAIWVLGYDKTYPDLWQLVSQKFTEK